MSRSSERNVSSRRDTAACSPIPSSPALVIPEAEAPIALELAEASL